jgi:hypothetical protein
MAETEIGDRKKGGAETQERICGRACLFCSFLFIMPLQTYASGGKNYSTNDTYFSGDYPEFKLLKGKDGEQQR